MERFVCLILGYICGLFQTGYIYGRLHHIDIRKHGSGNAGTTNALRTLGWKAGAVTFLGDSLKCVLAVAIAYMIYGKSHNEMFELLAMYAGNSRFITVRSIRQRRMPIVVVSANMIFSNVSRVLSSQITSSW